MLAEKKWVFYSTDAIHRTGLKIANQLFHFVLPNPLFWQFRIAGFGTEKYDIDSLKGSGMNLRAFFKNSETGYHVEP